MSKLILEFNTDTDDGEEKVKRVIHTDDAFSLIFEISSEIRTHLKHGDDKDNIRVLERIQEMIYESGLLEMYS